MVSAVCGGGLARGGGAGPPSCCILRRYAISLSMTAAWHRLGRRLVAAATWSALPPTAYARSTRSDLDTIELRHTGAEKTIDPVYQSFRSAVEGKAQGLKRCPVHAGSFGRVVGGAGLG